MMAASSREMSNPAAAGVVVYFDQRQESSHERQCHFEISRWLAELQGFEFAGEYDPMGAYPPRVYFVPTETIGDLASARQLGIKRAADLFGGVVPADYIATKVITHPLINANARAPAKWSHRFGERVFNSVLKGLSVFSMEDARAAGLRLLVEGPVRVKAVCGRAGRGQTMVETADELDAVLPSLNQKELQHFGLVLEEHLEDVRTLSVGRVQVANLIASYHGSQRLTQDNQGNTVYGGSDITVRRGDFEQLLASELSADAKLAVEHAKTYDDAACECFQGFLASRRNYDIAEGLDAQGKQRCGVLEQSWRIGGASCAEVAALRVLKSQPTTQWVRASSIEIYGENAVVPMGAEVLYRGLDEEVGFITKCVLVESGF